MNYKLYVNPSTIYTSSTISCLFFIWSMYCLLFLMQVMLTYLVYEKQHKLRIMMKMHGLRDGPYWVIYYLYFLLLSSIYMLLFVIFGSLIGKRISYKWLVKLLFQIRHSYNFFLNFFFPFFGCRAKVLQPEWLQHTVCILFQLH